MCDECFTEKDGRSFSRFEECFGITTLSVGL